MLKGSKRSSKKSPAVAPDARANSSQVEKIVQDHNIHGPNCSLCCVYFEEHLVEEHHVVDALSYKRCVEHMDTKYNAVEVDRSSAEAYLKEVHDGT
eukprot:scaffold8256_cov119-Skeletonema_marinoi.AAC.2